ncbi:MAG: hypothetical protein RBT74_12875 [Tenuifilaceae bacterium]|jgi:hypothetical protein|nr:hypothetical protein [Tenuifilaceae bacterium]
MKIRIVAISTICLLAAACSQQGERRQSTDPDYKGIELSAEVGTRKIFYRFPAPNDIINYIKTERLIYLKDFLNPVSHSDKYFDTRILNFNLGVYSADFAYITVFKTLSEASEYFRIIEKIAYQTGLSSIFDENMRRRVEANEANIDSLSTIARDSYTDMVQHLTAIGSEEQLSIISAGGYVEVLYLALNQTDDIEKDYQLLRKIYDQRFGLENLILFMNEFTNDPWINSLHEDLNAILNQLRMIEEKTDGESKTRRTGSGAFSITGGRTTITISSENYQMLKQTVANIRQKYTTPQ